MLVKVPVQFNGYVKVEVSDGLNYADALLLAKKKGLASIGDIDIFDLNDGETFDEFIGESSLDVEEAEDQWAYASVAGVQGSWQEGIKTAEEVDDELLEELEVAFAADDDDDDGQDWQDEDDEDGEAVEIWDCRYCGEDLDRDNVCVSCGKLTTTDGR